MRLLNAYYRNEQALAIEMATKQQHEEEIRLNRKVQIILGALIAALILLFVFFRRWIGQRRKLERLTFEQDKTDTLRMQELESLRGRFNAIEEERNRIARELHDDIGSSISSASIFADLAIQVVRDDQEKARVLMIRAKAKTQEISENISDLIWAIYSRNDSWWSLIERIRNFCFEILSSKEIEVKILDDKQLHDLQIPIQYKKSLLLFLKEAVNNIAKYSQATEVSIRIELENELITLQIDDNGVGFDTSLSTKGNGLLNFQAHAKSIKGSLEIVSAPGQGTHIRLSFPNNFSSLGM
jgi:signal transduction histidine kinase